MNTPVNKLASFLSSIVSKWGVTVLKLQIEICVEHVHPIFTELGKPMNKH